MTIDLPPEPPAIIQSSYNNIRSKLMIKLEFQNKIYTVDEDYKISPKEDLLQDLIDVACMEYGNPSQGFKTSFVADKLKFMGCKVLDVYDKEMEDAPEGVVY